MSDEAYVLELVRAAEDKFRGRNRRIKDAFQRRFMLHPVAIPEAHQTTATEVRTPIIFDLVRRVVGIQGPTLPRPVVPPLDEKSEKSRERSSLVEAWLTAFYEETMRVVFQQCIDAMPCDGAMVFKATLDRHVYGNLRSKDDDEDPGAYTDYARKARRKLDVPFSVEHVATSTYYPMRRGPKGDLRECLVITDREALPVSGQYKLGVGPKGKLVPLGEAVGRPGEANRRYPKTCKFIEHWDETDYCYLVDGKKVEGGKHPYGRPPFFEAESEITSIKDEAYRSVGLVFPLMGIQDNIDSLLTMQQQWVYIACWAALVLKQVSEDAVPLVESDIVLKWEPGKPITPPFGYEPKWMEAPPIGMDLTTLREFFKNMADSVSLAPILHGVAGGSDVSNVLANSLIAIAKSIFGPGLKNVALSFDDFGGFVLRMIDTELKMPVPVYQKSAKGKGEWLEIGPDEIDGYYQVHHELHPVIPAEKQVMYTMLADAETRGYVDDDHVREKSLDIPNPEEMGKRVRVKKSRQWPEIRQLHVDRLMERLNAGSAQPEAPIQAQASLGTPEAMPIGPGGAMQPQVAGIQQPMTPGMPGSPMTARNGVEEMAIG